MLLLGATGGTRTRTPSRTTDFKSGASTIPPPWRKRFELYALSRYCQGSGEKAKGTAQSGSRFHPSPALTCFVRLEARGELFIGANHLKSMKRALLGLLTLLISGVAETGAQVTTPLNVAAAAAYSFEQRGDAVLVIQRGEIVFEEYQNGFSASQPHLLASGTKSFSGALLVAAQADGLIASVDERVSDTILEWRGDPLKKEVTLRQLLSLTSGLASKSADGVPSYAAAVQLPIGGAARFAYGPAPFQVFGEVMRRKLQPSGETVTQYLNRRVLQPIGLRVGAWANAASGQPNLPSGAALTAREWVKFGQLLGQNGVWNNQSVLPSELLQSLFQGSKINPAYGLTFWLNAAGVGAGRNADFSSGLAPAAPKDLLMAAGAGNQRLYIVPSLDLVIVRFGRNAPYSDAEFMARLLNR